MARAWATISVRLDPPAALALERQAAERGVSLSEHVREVLGAAVRGDGKSPSESRSFETGGTPGQESRSTAGVTPEEGEVLQAERKKKARTSACEHRVPASAFCKECDS